MKEEYSPSCQFNDGVGCWEHNLCSRCGWNPNVTAARKRMIRIYGPNITVNAGRCPKSPGPVSTKTDEECMQFIERNYKGFGGGLTQYEVREALKIGSGRCTELLARVKERKEKR